MEVDMLRMVMWGIAFGSLSGLALAASSSKTEIVEEQEKSETKVFCSKVSEKAAVTDCEKWLGAQTKSLGSRLLTSYCSAGELSTNNSACLYKATGEIKYVLKTYRTEEKSRD
jgi:hypothetical protein